MLIIKYLVLKVKNLTHLSQKNEKKAGILTTVARKIELCSILFCNLVSRFGLILTKILFSIEWT